MLKMGGGIILIIIFQILLFICEKINMLLSHILSETHRVMQVKRWVIGYFNSLPCLFNLCASMAWFLVHTRLLCRRVHVDLTMFPGSNPTHLATYMSQTD